MKLYEHVIKTTNDEWKVCRSAIAQTIEKRCQIISHDNLLRFKFDIRRFVCSSAYRKVKIEVGIIQR